MSTPSRSGAHRRMGWVWPMLLTVILVALVAGCGTDPAASARPPARAWGPAAARPAWLQSVQMTSARVGWALHWTGNPAGSASVALVAARTTDGGRTWTNIDPRPKALIFDHPGVIVSAVLRASGDRRAWLAATAGAQSGYCQIPSRTRVFRTADGGRTWAESALIRAPGFARYLTFTDPANGWLLQDLGAAGFPVPHDYVQLYRTRDGARHWSLAAQTLRCPQLGTSPSGLPTYGDKTGVAFATTKAGWLTAGGNALADLILVTRDGGRRWKPRPVPLPRTFCQALGCAVTPPQFFGRTGYLTIGHPSHGLLLATRNLGVTWTRLPALPAGAGAFPQVRFFDSRHGIIVSSGAQGAIGQMFYLTSNGGRTWTPIRQGMRFNHLGFTVDFVSPLTGFAWIVAADLTGTQRMYTTHNGGRTWAAFTPKLNR